ncbi:transcriptional regulator [Ancylobacter sp. 6x-1]|uniref:Transcriptional regulator n=1 Tax=Ancylobacter crimeensis TaxID=2579147 RepID=A0ABT0DCZ1_9HYPH|nr:transcriptional regulator [Ancylobacter crimeensis]MCK0197832.1 transcriptional regulator [Ancylobacter crimeensis]
MSTKAFDKIAEGLAEATAIARGEAEHAKLFVPAEMDVRAIRTGLGMSQDGFATMFGFTVHQIRQWEQGRSRPLGAVRAFLLLIQTHPSEIMGMLREVSRDARKVA